MSGKTRPTSQDQHKTRKAAGRKRTQKSENTRLLILDAAARIFAEYGYTRTRLSDIAESLDIHLTGLYYYYDNKEELVSDIICHVPGRTAATLEAALDALPRYATNREKICRAIDVYLATILQDDHYVRAYHRIASQVSPEIRARAISVTRDINEIWKKLIDDGVKSGELRGDLDLTMVRMLMLGSMNWAVEWFQPRMGPPKAMAEVFKSMLFEGVARQRT